MKCKICDKTEAESNGICFNCNIMDYLKNEIKRLDFKIDELEKVMK